MAKDFLSDVDFKAGLLLNGSAGTLGYVLTSQGPGQKPVWLIQTGGAKYTVSATAPSSPANGDQWFDTTIGVEYVYIDDGNTSQWVETSSFGLSGSSVTIASSAADVLSASSGEISADDAGADKLVFWDDSAGKLTHLTVGSGLTISGTEITASGSGGGIDPVISGMIF